MSEQTEPLLVVSMVKHTFTTPRIRKFLHTLQVRQLLSVSCGIIARQCIIYYSVGFPSRKELALLEMCN